MEELVLHPTTELALLQYLRQPAHALLIVGDPGSGKHTIARALGAKLTEPAYIFNIEPTTSLSIGIEAVHDMTTRSKSKASIEQPRVWVINNAGSLTTEAQNAFLKLLEEPPANTYFILTARRSQELLATVVSRVQTTAVISPPDDKIRSHFSGVDPKEINKYIEMFDGRVGLIKATLGNPGHPLLLEISRIKELLSQDTFQKLAAVETLASDRQTALTFVEALILTARKLLRGAAVKTQPAAISKWSELLESALVAQDRLMANSQIKLTLSWLMLRL
jgi:hypothetical protein